MRRLGDWKWSARISHAVRMSITSKVVPIAEKANRLVARDMKAHRIIIGLAARL